MFNLQSMLLVYDLCLRTIFALLFLSFGLLADQASFSRGVGVQASGVFS